MLPFSSALLFSILSLIQKSTRFHHLCTRSLYIYCFLMYLCVSLTTTTHLWCLQLNVCVCFARQVEISVYETEAATKPVVSVAVHSGCEERENVTQVNCVAADHKNNNIINEARDAQIILLMIIIGRNVDMFKNKSRTHAFYDSSKFF